MTPTQQVMPKNEVITCKFAFKNTTGSRAKVTGHSGQLAGQQDTQQCQRGLGAEGTEATPQSSRKEGREGSERISAQCLRLAGRNSNHRGWTSGRGWAAGAVQSHVSASGQQTLLRSQRKSGSAQHHLWEAAEGAEGGAGY